ncbi:MAG: SAM-dependent methyltransferase [Gammaproteobacteria bacterium]|nr:SAM-dependent methyltransferase [Gammaproteobacteria bacterium]MDH4003464.1 SAM-dependent methyltransferase [Gammaproteobacteria bacterium]
MRRLLLATLFISAAAIGYEILLMRVLSIVQWHHFAYMIISLALLGYGASGTFIALLRSHLEPRFETAFAASALFFSIAMIVCFIVAQRVPFNALEIVWDRGQFLNLAVVYVVFFVPFFFAACCIGLAFTCRGGDASRIYFFDLFGAGLGAVLIIVLLFAVSPQTALVLLVLLPLAASAIMASTLTSRLPLAIAQLAWLALLAIGIPQAHLELRISEYKGLSQALQVIDSRILEQSSSPLGLITVVDSPTVPIRHAPGLSFNTRHIPPVQLAVFTDADGMSAITRYDGNPGSVAYLGDLTAALPFRLLENPVVLVLGAGTGSEVLLSLFHGASRVDAVELNPQMTELVAGTYADFAGRIYDDPRVTVYTDEARGFVARSGGGYDLVQIGLLDSFGASGAGVQALNESYIYTTGALREYLADLEPGGLLAITRWIKMPPRDSVKLIATAIEALRQSGVSEPGRRIAMIRSWNTSTLLIKNGDLTASEIGRIREFARSRSFDTVYFPGIRAEAANRFNRLADPYLFDAASALLGDSTGDFFERYKFYVEPASDDRPYFFHFFRWRTLPEVMALRKAGGAGLIEWGYLVLVATIVQAAVLGLVLILLPLSLVRRAWPAGTARRFGFYFLLLGLAFLFVEMAFIQKFILFLSNPLYSVAVVLSGFLLFAGLGSASSERLARRLPWPGVSPVTVAVAAIAVLALGYVLVLPAVFGRFIGLADPAKIIVSLALIAPLAFFMGMPFPLGLKRLSGLAPGFLPWAWGINGFASVVSAVLATLLAIEFGFNVVILLALVLYALAAWDEAVSRSR